MMRFTSFAALASLFALPAWTMPMASRAKQVEVGYKLGPLPLELRTVNGTHVRNYYTRHISTDPNARDSQGFRVLDAFPDGHNSSAQDFYFVSVGSEYKNTPAKGTFDDEIGGDLWGFLQSAANPAYGIGAPNIGNGHSSGHFAAIPLSYDDDESLNKQLFHVHVIQTDFHNSTSEWDQWSISFVGDQDKNNPYEITLADNDHQTVKWSTHAQSPSRSFGFPWDSRYLVSYKS